MSIRSPLAIALALSFLATPGFAFDTQSSRTAKSEACKAKASTCLVITVPGNRILSDHGADAGESYDMQGNLVDRHENVVASPATRDKPREVFATPVGVRF